MQTEQERRTLLAVGLCMMIYLVWMQFFVPPIEPIQPVTTASDLSTLSDSSGSTSTPSADLPPGLPATEAEQSPDNGAPSEISRPVQIAAHSKAFSTDAFEGVVHSQEGAFQSVFLKNYKAQPKVQPLWSWILDGAGEDWVSYQGGDDPEQLLTDQGAFFIAGSGNFGSDTNHWVQDENGTVIAKSRHSDGLSITKRYGRGADSRSMEIEVEFVNRGDRVVRDLWVGMADTQDGDSSDRFANVIRPFALVAEDIERVDDLTDLDGEKYERFDGKVDWFGLGNKYFMSVLVPLDEPAGEWVVDRLPDERIGSFFRLTQPLDVGAKRSLRFRGYMGPKDIDKTAGVGGNLERSVEFGWFGLFAKILLSMLKFFHGLVGNWGVAILLLTCTVKAIFFPLMQKQFVSSKRMQAIQPQLKEIKAKYKDNMQLQQQMTMELFKEHKVNPMSGCLPMIIQMPVWFALYNVMLYSVELYGTSFLYLKDLTEVDPTGALPLIVSVLMVLQQKMMPMGNMDPMQQKMMRIMPIGFGLFMFTFPAGLVLYFSVNNLLTIAQQWFIYRKSDDPSPSTKAKGS